MSLTRTKPITMSITAFVLLSLITILLTGCHQDQANSSVPTVAEQQQANAQAQAKENARLTPEQQAAAAKAQAATNAGIKPEH
jgi:hypothetical protein